MKTVIILGVIAVGLVAAIACVSQNKGQTEVFAYSREVIGGARKVERVTDNSHPRDVSTKQAPQYLIYLTTSTDSIPDVREIYINGENYHVSVEKAAVPVIAANPTMPSDPKDTLVSANARHAWRIQLRNKVEPGTVAVDHESMIKENELVLVMFVGVKEHFLPVKKIKILSPVALQ
ncbi:MAG: hypothetical protein H7Y27_10515 [Gemmatimonadaceae bacterium]|nr:hypothetical protein [Chitinophagaceae bacterium]